jgi:hypothetical protein
VERRPDVRVSTVELFFDLVFVFTITQLTSLLAEDPTALGVVRMILVFGPVWWMYGGYAWLTNAVPPREPGLRLLMLVGMAGFLVVALAIPRAFDASGVAFGLGYLVVNLVHTGMFLRSTEESTVRAIVRLGPFNAITAVLLLVAGFTDGAVQWSLWAGVQLHWITPYITNVSGFTIRAAHFVERHGLILLIALGESIVAIGIGVEGRALGGGFILTSASPWPRRSGGSTSTARTSGPSGHSRLQTGTVAPGSPSTRSGTHFCWSSAGSSCSRPGSSWPSSPTTGPSPRPRRGSSLWASPRISSASWHSDGCWAWGRSAFGSSSPASPRRLGSWASH